jgi:hypothetical protein
VANVARVYDVLLGGKDNFAADRQAADKLLDAVPGAAVAARENRAFLGRAVRFLAEEAGVRQFLDIGAGLPAARAVHEIVAGCVPPPRVVYVDNDPVVVRHAEVLAGGVLGVDAIRADLRQPWELFAQPTVRSLINLAEPMAILLVAVLASSRSMLLAWVRYRAKPQVAGVPATAVTCGSPRTSGSRTRKPGRCVFLRRVSPGKRKTSSN